ncbi:hypothetical protein SmJEL517_g02010 [Synchytrium microbalum]|uniref:non-specific serine/threonine protein kinase n=1 Tax=Synchytrium microbalum TaxID=1806994 RepID=A0A507C7V8_9FUNG|nr:uncharacterized protein SmJEL517_g02010 [Synchytrium microbalum]TPX35692.1 hypothetical protein SmJEL517_g02010 [Synchytrium microbalum]
MSDQKVESRRHRYTLPAAISTAGLSPPTSNGIIAPFMYTPISPTSYRSTSSPTNSAYSAPIPSPTSTPYVPTGPKRSLEDSDDAETQADTRDRKRVRPPPIIGMPIAAVKPEQFTVSRRLSATMTQPPHQQQSRRDYPVPVSPTRISSSTNSNVVQYLLEPFTPSSLVPMDAIARPTSRGPTIIQHRQQQAQQQSQQQPNFLQFHYYSQQQYLQPPHHHHHHQLHHHQHQHLQQQQQNRWNFSLSPIDTRSIMSAPVMPSTLTPISDIFTVHPLASEAASCQDSGKDVSEVISDNGTRKWVLLKPLGKGGCGEVFLGREYTTESRATAGPLVALKFVKDRKQYNAELTTMKLLNYHKNGRGRTPQLIHACRKDRVLVMEYLSESLGKKFETLAFKFSLKTILMLGLNIINLTKDFHERTGLVHVDIKPSNFMTRDRELFMIDFGYAALPHARLPGQTGTPLFMSWTIQTYGSTYPCFMDDLESIGYCIMFWIASGKKGLPWGHLRSHRDIAAAKTDLAITTFCNSLAGTEYSPIGPTLEKYILFTRDRVRAFAPETDYDYLSGLLNGVLDLCGMKNDGLYDWLF